MERNFVDDALIYALQSTTLQFTLIASTPYRYIAEVINDERHIAYIAASLYELPKLRRLVSSALLPSLELLIVNKVWLLKLWHMSKNVPEILLIECTML